MLVLPAIDLKGGRCVRLVQGRADRETVYDDHPARVARAFQDAGARMLHLVDLDGAFEGETANLQAIQSVRAAVSIPIELGGGMRTVEAIRGMLALGIDSVIVGTMAVQDAVGLESALKEAGPGQIQLGIDARNGMVSIRGWQEDTPLEAAAFARHWRSRGIERVIFTDISRDGMLQGPNIEAIRDFAQQTEVRVTASGGVSHADDIRALEKLESLGVDRVIVGKALYEGTVTLAEVL